MKIPVIRKIYGLILVVALAALFYVLYNSKNQENRMAGESAQTEATGQPAEEESEVHPISLKALAQKDFDGRELVLGRVLSDETSYTRYYITYKSGELTISGIMNVPKGQGPFPVIFLNHGYIDPAVYTNGRGLRREQDYLARQRYVVIHSDYRNHAESGRDPDNDVNFRLGYAEDVINAIYAVRNSDLEFFDKEKIGMLGHSMGGGVTLNILTARPDLVGAAVLFAPVSGNAIDNYNRWTVSRPETARRISQLFGSPDTNPEFWKNISPNSFIEKIQAPILLHHGTADEDVPLAWSDELAELLRQNGKSIDYRVYDGQPHEFTTSWGEVMRLTLDFYNQNLK